MDDYSVIGRSLFKKETNIQLFVGLRVQLSTGELGVIDSAFGQSGKFKVHVPGEWAVPPAPGCPGHREATQRAPGHGLSFPTLRAGRAGGWDTLEGPGRGQGSGWSEQGQGQRSSSHSSQPWPSWAWSKQVKVEVRGQGRRTLPLNLRWF